MKYLIRLLVVLAVLTLGTTALATTATAGGSDGIAAPRNWDGGGIVYYGDPDGGGAGGINLGVSSETTYRTSASHVTDLKLFSGRWMIMWSYLLEAQLRQQMRNW